MPFKKFSGAIAIVIAVIAYAFLAPDDAPSRQGAAHDVRPLPETAQPRQSSEPARTTNARAPFDFYVLSLSWSPTWCARAGNGDNEQCRRNADHAFVVHGLWPQFERGYPSFCNPQSAGPAGAVRDALLRIMPSRSLIAHEWEKHGTCSGLDGNAYGRTILNAWDAIRIPPMLRAAESQRRLSPQAIENAFLEANPALEREDMAVICAGGRLIEMRICLDDSLSPRACREVREETCSGGDILLPAAP